MLRAFCTLARDRAIRPERRDAKAQSSQLTRRSTLALVLLLSCLALPGCHPTVALAPCSTSNCACTGLDITNTHFEVRDQPTLRQSRSLWLSGSHPDQLTFKWDTYTFHLHPNGVTCDVDECVTPLPSCNQAHFTSDPALIPIVDAYQGFVRSPPPAVINTGGGVPITYQSGCRSFQSTAGYVAPFFTPTFSGVYELHTPHAQVPDASYDAVRVFVVSGGMPQMATYPTSRYSLVDSHYPDIKWYTWATGGDTVWDDNFSANLQVSKIRLLRGRPRQDPTNGMMSLDDATPVRPSSIVLSPAFIQGNSVIGQNQLRCYADSSADGNIDLTSCRGSATSATPAYLKARPADKLTWVAEFNPNETQTPGATAPTLGPNEVLVIEFTIRES